MPNQPPRDVMASEAPNLINKLIRFLSPKKVEAFIRESDLSISSTNASPFFREYYIKNRHPWHRPLKQFLELDKQGKSIKSNLTTELKALAVDALRITELARTMPESIRNKYETDLLDVDRAKDYLFEIEMAWHFHSRQNHKICWHQDTSKQSSEFTVNTDHFEFEVECKTISPDAGRKVHRGDFLRFADILFGSLKNMGLQGKLGITLKERLESKDSTLDNMASKIIERVQDNKKGSFKLEFGKIEIDFLEHSDEEMDFNIMGSKFQEKLHPWAHGIIMALRGHKPPYCVNPISIVLQSVRGDEFVKTLKEKLSEAGKKQLSNSKPGLICCFLPEIEDFSKLGKKNNLELLSRELFQKPDLSHIAAILYKSDASISPILEGDFIGNQTLTYYNDSCRFEKVKEYKFSDKTR